MTNALREVLRNANRAAYRRAAKAVCFGCARGWEHTADGHAHRAPGANILFECSAFKIWKLPT